MQYLQLQDHVSGTGETLAGVRVKETLQQASYRPSEVCVSFSGQCLGGGVPSQEQECQRGAEGEQIRAWIGPPGLVSELFRRAPPQGSSAGRRWRGQFLGEIEIDEHGLESVIRSIDHDVSGFDVPVDHATLVEVLAGPGELKRQGETVLVGQRRGHLHQCAARGPGGHEHRQALPDRELHETGHPGMFQPCQKTGGALQTAGAGSSGIQVVFGPLGHKVDLHGHPLEGNAPRQATQQRVRVTPSRLRIAGDDVLDKVAAQDLRARLEAVPPRTDDRD